MVKHIVFFKMKDEALGNSGIVNARLMSGKFQELIAKIDTLKSIETGVNLNNEKYDLCLYCEFESQKALDDYLGHPAHLEVREYVMQVIDHRVVVDYAL